jgi:hypothetical protein
MRQWLKERWREMRGNAMWRGVELVILAIIAVIKPFFGANVARTVPLSQRSPGGLRVRVHQTERRLTRGHHQTAIRNRVLWRWMS